MQGSIGNEIIIQDVSDIPGTNCYLDEDAKTLIVDKYKEIGYKGLHILGSGNYHYLTYLWLSKIGQDFSLLTFDNHPDMQNPAFGDILSCGSWVLAANNDYKNLKHIYICGADDNHIEQEGPYPENVYFIKDTSEIDDAYPLYVSIDKDVLGYKFAKTDWDQGVMTLDELCLNLKMLGYKNILGIDICGDTKTEPEGSEINKYSNEQLLPICLSLLESSTLS